MQTAQARRNSRQKAGATLHTQHFALVMPRVTIAAAEQFSTRNPHRDRRGRDNAKQGHKGGSVECRASRRIALGRVSPPLGMSRYRLAKEINVPAQRIGEIISGKRAVSADTDLRLCKFFGLSNGYWLRAQVAHDIEAASAQLAEQLRQITPWNGSTQ